MNKNAEFFTPPETKHEITAEEFIRTAKGYPFMQTDWFYRKKGREIKDKALFGDHKLDDDQLYIVLQETRCLSSESAAFLIDKLKGAGYKPAFIFINCILPGIILMNSYTSDWIFLSTHVNDGIWVDNNQMGNFRLQNSRCGYIHIGQSSKSNGIVIENNSRVGNLKIYDNGECGDISINTNGQCGDIEIDNGRCKHIDVHDNSEMGNLKIGNKGQIGKISIEMNCHAGDIKVYGDGRCGNIAIENNSNCKDVRVETNAEIGSVWVHDNSQCGCINIERNSRCKDVWLDNESQSDYIDIYEESQCRHILIEGNSQCGYIHIGTNSQSGHIVVKQNSKSDSILLDSNSKAAYISINDNSQSESVELSNNSQCDFIEIDKQSLIGPITVRRNSHLESLKVDGKSQSGDIKIDEGDVKKVEIIDNYCSVLLRNATVSIMQLYNCCIHKLSWQSGTKVELYIDSCTINYLNLHKTSILNDAVVSITNSKIYIVQLQELLTQGQIMLRNIRISTEPFAWQPTIVAYLKENRPKEEGCMLEIYNSKWEMLQKQEDAYDTQKEALEADPTLVGHIKPLFRIANSSLGKTEITGGDLTGFHFEYEDSKLLEVFINSAKLPRDKIDIYNRKPGIDLPDEIYYEQKISIYNQLKRIFENQGDIVASSWYHSKAMANQERLLSLQYAKKGGKAPGKWFSEEAFNLLNFRLNKISNNHGESWRRALGFSVCVLFSIYTFYFISVNAGKPFSIYGASDFIGSFFSFLDITHKSDFLVDKQELNVFSKFLDSFGRAALLYCTYQFVSAFRRHGKRG